jgi:CHAT domain-containing protein
MFVAVAAALTVAAAAWPSLRQFVLDVRREHVIGELLSSIDQPAVLQVRLSAPSSAKADSDVPPDRAAADVLEAVEGDDRPDSKHAAGIAMLVTGRQAEGLRALRLVADSAPTAGRWNDVAAAELLLARGQPDATPFAALTAVQRALDLDPELPEALFNRALIIKQLGLSRMAREAWQHYFRRESEGVWAAEARRRLRADQLRTAKEEWAAYREKLDRLQPQDLAGLAQRFPLQIRGAAEWLLVQWANASLRGDDAASTRYLTAARTIGFALQARSGDTVVLAAVVATESSARRREVAEAFRRYGEGRRLLRERRNAEAARELDTAREKLVVLRHPMAKIAAYWLAVASRYDNQAAAAKRLAHLLRRCDPVADASLRAQVQADLALASGAEGRWQSAREAADEAIQLYRRLGDKESAASVGVGVIGILSLTGQAAEARRYAVRTFRELDAAGNDDRLSAAFTAAGHAEIRRSEWQMARALSAIELQLPATRGDALLRTDAYMRLAAAEFNLGLMERASTSIAAARSAALELPKGRQQAQTLADIDGVEGAMSRRRNAPRAVALLTQSIAYQEDAGRLFALPKLHLERGRVFAATGQPVEAAKDYETGIAILEQQRSHAVETWQQVGIFDNASALFDEAAELALRSNDIERAFATVERRRARALLDELVAESGRGPRIAASVRFRSALSADVVVIEYAHIGPNLIAFVLTGDRLEARRLPADVVALAEEVRGVAAELSHGGDADARLRKLRTVLIDPLHDQLAGRVTVVIVPDPIVQRVPFAALIDDRTGQYFVEQYRVLVAPSVVTFAASRETSAPTKTPLEVAAFGNPALLNSDFEPLPESELEAVFVGRRHPGSKVRLEREATKQRFIDALMSCDAVHYAGHATNSALEPWRSALLLASPDGELTAREIVQLQRIKARLVILAACSTAGDVAVEGSPVLAHAFLIAGVPTVIATLWDIEDGDSGPLMIALHERLAKGMAAAEALRDAQLSLLRSPRPEYRHPSRWAAFVVYGLSAVRESAPRRPPPAGQATRLRSRSRPPL